MTISQEIVKAQLRSCSRGGVPAAAATTRPTGSISACRVSPCVIHDLRRRLSMTSEITRSPPTKTGTFSAFQSSKAGPYAFFGQPRLAMSGRRQHEWLLQLDELPDVVAGDDFDCQQAFDLRVDVNF